MCTISWYVSLESPKEVESKYYLDKLNNHVLKNLTLIAQKWEERGKDWIWLFASTSVTYPLERWIFFKTFSPYHSNKWDEEKFLYSEIKKAKWLDDFYTKDDIIYNHYLKGLVFKTCLVHNRAIPESEFELDNNLNHTQPIVWQYFTIIHNWIIANDKELVEKYDLRKDYKIDTEALLLLLEYKLEKELERHYEILRREESEEEIDLEILREMAFDNIDIDDLIVETLREVKGSYSLAIYSHFTKSTFIWSNFQSLYYSTEKINIDNSSELCLNWLYFSSSKEYLERSILDYNLEGLSTDQIKERLLEVTQFNLWINSLDAYSYLYIIPWHDDTALVRRNSLIWEGLLEESKVPAKWIVLASGWLDTCVVAWIMKKDYGCKDLLFLHYDYGHKVEKQEQEALKKIVEYYWWEYKSIKLDFLFELFKDTPLVKGVVNNDGKWLEQALEYVPQRNTLFTFITAAYAEMMWYNYIWTWICLSESMAYPDTTIRWLDSINTMLRTSSGVNKNIQVIAPLKNMLKDEIVREGIRVWAPMNLSWSCYQDNWTWKHCKVCASCRLREIWMGRNGLDIEWKELEKVENKGDSE